MNRRAALASVAWLALSAFTREGSGPKAELWPRWQAHDPVSTIMVDHAPWGAFLTRYVQADETGVHRVAYARVSAADRSALQAYVQAAQAVPVDRLSRPEQMAFWINLYNALTVETVLAHYPVESIRDIRLDGSGFFTGGPWRAKLIRVAGEALSLDDIEHRILRPIHGDARIHYAINCAAVGCPNLARAPYSAATLDSQLDTAARAYVNHLRGVNVRGERMTVSRIYEWFSPDFGGSAAAVKAHLLRYAAPELAAAIQAHTGTMRTAYDWALNDAP